MAVSLEHNLSVLIVLGVVLGTIGGFIWSRRQRRLAEEETDKQLAAINRKKEFGLSGWEDEYRTWFAGRGIKS